MYIEEYYDQNNFDRRPLKSQLREFHKYTPQSKFSIKFIPTIRKLRLEANDYFYDITNYFKKNMTFY